MKTSNQLSQKMKVAAVSFMLVCTTAVATPTYSQIDEAIAANNYPAAKVMMIEVLRKRPESLKAHYLNYELLLANGASKDELSEERKIIDAIQSGNPVAQSSPNSFMLRCLLLCATLLTVFVGVLIFRGVLKTRKVKSIETYPDNYSTPLSTHNL